jgi:hypothetical protein
MNEFGENPQKPNKHRFKRRKAWLFGQALMEGQLKERSEGVQAQWQTALVVVMAAGS